MRKSPYLDRIRRTTGVILAVVLMTTAACQSAPIKTQTQPTQGKPTNTTSNATPSSVPPSSATRSPDLLLGSDLMAGIKRRADAPQANKPDAGTLAAQQAFAVRLLLEAAGTKGNAIVSPTSVYLALSMALNGARGQTRVEMLKTLGAEGLDDQAFNQRALNLTAALKPAGNYVKLSIANSIWLRDSFSASPEFLQRNADYYAAAARKLDFDAPSAVDTINGWVQENTGGKIKEIINTINPDHRLFLINAIHFLADWQTQFKTENTRTDRFHAPGGDRQISFMNDSRGMEYLSGDGATGILLPYKEQDYALAVLLPAQGTTPRDWLATWNGSTLAQLLTSAQGKQVELALPSFELNYSIKLNDALSRMGMPLSFTDMADFTGMQAAGAPDERLMISEVKHKTYLRVDERGTEAAAVTSIGITATGMLEPVQLKVDRPFILAIIHGPTMLPLFLGIVEDPTIKETEG